MATRSLATDKSVTGPSMGLREEDYRTFCAALESTQRGRDFLVEYARRNRNADTEMLLDSLDRIETMMRAEGAARDRLQDELRVLLIAIRLARPDINSATALTKAARLVDLLDLMESRIDAMVENKDLPPIAEEPRAPQAPFMVVPQPDEPELPIPSVGTILPPPIALVQEPARLVIKPLPNVQESKQAAPKQDLPKPEMAKPAPAPTAAPIQQAPKPGPKQAAPLQAPATTELQDHEWAQLEILNRPKTHTTTAAEPYEVWEPATTALEAPAAAAPEPAAPLAATPELTAPEQTAAVASAPQPTTPEPVAPVLAAPEKWLPDFGSEERIIHTKPVTAAAFMPEVVFMSAPARPAVAETKAETAVVDVAVTSVITAAAESVTAAAIEPAATAKVVPPRVDPLSAIMSLSEAERIALFT